MEQWLVSNWYWVAIAVFVVDKIVAKTPNKYDDLIFTAIKGIIKKLAGKGKK